MCKIKSRMFSVVFFMFYICVICDCVCVLKYAIYLIWPRQFSFGPDSSHLAHVFLIWLIPWPEQKMSQRGPCVYALLVLGVISYQNSNGVNCTQFKIIAQSKVGRSLLIGFYCCLADVCTSGNTRTVKANNMAPMQVPIFYFDISSSK